MRTYRGSAAARWLGTKDETSGPVGPLGGQPPIIPAMLLTIPEAGVPP